jgi:hypothetical protein
MLADHARQNSITRYFRSGDGRWEPFFIEIVKNNFVAVFLQGFDGSGRDGVVKTPNIGMGKNNGYFRGFSRPSLKDKSIC